MGDGLHEITATPPAATDTPDAVRAVRSAAPKKSADGKFIGRRAKKPKLLAVITDACTGCAGAPVCQLYCPVDDCMLLIRAEEFPYQRIWVDPLKCVGCKKCITRGPENAVLDGCPWDAIRMVTTADWEAEHGELAY
jgi:ferredoxin